jgi:hypothetical protein
MYFKIHVLIKCSIHFLERDNSLGFYRTIQRQQDHTVQGSSWPKDEESILITHINNSAENIKNLL